MRLDISHGETELSALLENIRAEPADALSVIGEVHFPFFADTAFGMLGKNMVQHLFHPFSCGCRSFDGEELPIDAENDRSADLDMDVGSPALDGRVQDTLKKFHACNLSRPGIIRPVSIPRGIPNAPGS